MICKTITTVAIAACLLAGPGAALAHADTAETMRRHHVRRETLWGCIYDGTVPAPVVWIDDRPGWRR